MYPGGVLMLLVVFCMFPLLEEQYLFFEYELSSNDCPLR